MRQPHPLSELINDLRCSGFHIPLSMQEDSETDTVCLADLLRDNDILQSRVTRLSNRMGTFNTFAVASLFQKRFSFVLLAAILTPLSTIGVGILPEPAHTRIIFQDDLPVGLLISEHHVPLILLERLPMRLAAYPATDWLKVEEAQTLRTTVFRSLFDSIIGPLIYRIASQFGLSPKVMWANVGSTCAGLYEKICDTPISIPHALEDREALLENVGFTAPPLANTYKSIWLQEAQPAQWVRVQSACCLRHCLPNNRPCLTCPRLAPSERADLMKVVYGGK